MFFTDFVENSPVKFEQVPTNVYSLTLYSYKYSKLLELDRKASDWKFDESQFLSFSRFHNIKHSQDSSKKLSRNTTFKST